MTKTIKPLIAVVLCLATIFFTACSSDNTKNDTQNAVNNSTSNAEQNNQETTQTVTDDGLTMEQAVVFDKADVKVTATRYEGNSKISNIYFTIENNSDRKVEVFSKDVTINDVSTENISTYSDLLFFVELESDTEAETRIYITANDKNAIGIEKIEQVQLYISALIYDENGKYIIESETSDLITLNINAQ